MLLIIALSRSHYRFNLPSKLVFIFSAWFELCHLATCVAAAQILKNHKFLRGAGFTRSQAVVTFALICVIDLLQLLPVHEVAVNHLILHAELDQLPQTLDEGSLGSLVRHRHQTSAQLQSWQIGSLARWNVVLSDILVFISSVSFRLLTSIYLQKHRFLQITIPSGHRIHKVSSGWPRLPRGYLLSKVS